MKKITFLFSALLLVFSFAAAAELPPVPLHDDQYIEAKEIPDQASYSVSTTVGNDVEFKLGEAASKNERWQVLSYDDPTQCRIKIDHEKKGFWPMTKEYAEIELKGLKRGTQKIVLQCGTKRITITFHAL